MGLDTTVVCAKVTGAALRITNIHMRLLTEMVRGVDVMSVLPAGGTPMVSTIATALSHSVGA